MLFAFISLLLTGSRAAIGGVIISVYFLLYKLKPKIFIRIFISMIVLLIIFILVPELNNLISLYFRIDRLMANRNIYWELAYNIFKHNLLLGVGPGLFQQSAYKFLPFSIGSWDEFQVRGLFAQQAGTGHAHDFFLFRASELGILGLILAILLFIVFFYFCFKTSKLAKSINKKYYILSITITAIGLGLLARSFYEATGFLTYGWIARDLPFWLIFIILISIYQNLKNIPSKMDKNNYVIQGDI